MPTAPSKVLNINGFTCWYRFRTEAGTFSMPAIIPTIEKEVHAPFWNSLDKEKGRKACYR
jgi:hypothetical protein